LDFNVYRPTVILVEFDSKAQRKKIEAILFQHDYHFIASLRNNLFSPFYFQESWNFFMHHQKLNRRNNF